MIYSTLKMCSAPLATKWHMFDVPHRRDKEFQIVASQRRTSRWKISRLSFLVCMKSGVLSVSSVRGRGAA